MYRAAGVSPDRPVTIEQAAIIERNLNGLAAANRRGRAYELALDQAPAIRDEINRTRGVYRQEYEGKPAYALTLQDSQHFWDRLQLMTGLPLGDFFHDLTAVRRDLGARLRRSPATLGKLVSQLRSPTPPQHRSPMDLMNQLVALVP